MRAVDREHVNLGFREFLRALQKITGSSDGCADAQAAVGVLGGVGILQFLLDVLNRDQAFQVVLVVDDREAFRRDAREEFSRRLRA